ncbi:TOPRIM nucleotidyl transferase/hydrolase domain-containing protein [Leifsonia sp. LS-T14]|uniref:TOPRIM nucleotidyl transferase/hydrolase domain-containing protein n=1 Tax=unclassified Leifsonia TaxID=2663824 RepID=UPI0035A73BA6
MTSQRADGRSAILVEGASDRAAVLAAADLLGVDLAADGVRVVPMGGAMSVRRFVAELGPAGAGLGLRGLCDAGEVRFFERAGLPDELVFVCRPDLEAELIGALGHTRTEEVLEREGDLRLFRTFQQQPAQRTRTLDQQLHRFFGTTSGRKEHYGAVLTSALSPDELPAPLRDVVHPPT